MLVDLRAAPHEVVFLEQDGLFKPMRSEKDLYSQERALRSGNLRWVNVVEKLKECYALAIQSIHSGIVAESINV